MTVFHVRALGAFVCTQVNPSSLIATGPLANCESLTMYRTNECWPYSACYYDVAALACVSVEAYWLQTELLNLVALQLLTLHHLRIEMMATHSTTQFCLSISYACKPWAQGIVQYISTTNPRYLALLQLASVHKLASDNNHLGRQHLDTICAALQLVIQAWQAATSCDKFDALDPRAFSILNVQASRPTYLPLSNVMHGSVPCLSCPSFEFLGIRVLHKQASAHNSMHTSVHHRILLWAHMQAPRFLRAT